MPEFALTILSLPDKTGSRMRIAIVINTSWNIFNFRMNLAKALQAVTGTK